MIRESNSQEVWREIPGFAGKYSISDLGRVWARSTRSVIYQRIGNRGYPMVNLSAPDSRKPRLVHQLVLLAFVGPRPEGFEVRHLDGDKANAALSNLKYGRRSENIADWGRLHETPAGMKNGRVKLTVQQVLQIRAACDAGGRQVEIAKEFGVDQSLISLIKNRRKWKFLDQQVTA